LVGPATVRGLVVLDQGEEAFDLQRRIAVDDELETLLLKWVREYLEQKIFYKKRLFPG
jgi:hypothetical protein